LLGQWASQYSPSLLATALLLQAHDGVSDEEAKARADFDLRWKVALGVGLEERPFAKSALPLFRARLILHEQVRTVFQQRLTFARRTDYFRQRKIRVVLDTSYILGSGAVKDTYNLLGDGVNKLAGALAASCGRKPEEWAREYGLSRYFGSSLKGEAAIDWDDAQAREVFLQSVVCDAKYLLDRARATLERIPMGDPGRERLGEAAALLELLLLQDIERREDGTYLKQGVSPDRVVSVHDPEMRHGRKSASRRFDGYKAAIAVDPESQLITAVDVLAGNAPEHERALELVEQAEANAGVMVDEAVGDCAYGGSNTRQTFAEAGRKLVAKVANRHGQAQFSKDDFRIDLQSMSCECPAAQQTRKAVSISSGERYGAPGVPLRAFRFDAAICDGWCSWRGFVEPRGARVRLLESNHKEAPGRYVAPFHPRIPADRGRPPRPPSPARLPLGTRLALWPLAPFLRVEPIRALAPHIVERLTETPFTASTYSQRSRRVANGRSWRSASRSFPTRSSILGGLPGALPGSRDSPLWALAA
jgi:hypothetical protein